MQHNMKELYQAFLNSSGVCTDTRAIKENSIFFALKGANFNGNEFANEALNKGAKYVVIDEDVLPVNEFVFKVNNVLEGLQELANYHRKQFDIPVIGITGSNGKTTTKELVYAVLSNTMNPLVTKGNLNNHIGVPLTLLELNKSHDVAIIEMGASKPGDINELAGIALPTFGIITNIGKAHIEGFGSPEGVFQTKTELYRQMNDDHKTILVNNAYTELLREAKHTSCKTVTFELGYGHSKAVNYSYKPQSTYLPMAAIEYEDTEIISKLIGSYNCENLAVATSVGLEFGLSIEQVKNGVENYVPNNNRSELQLSGSNIIIWDAYNANPSSVAKAIDNMETMDSKKSKLLILGDMNELGSISKTEHQQIIDRCKKLNMNTIFVGPLYTEFQLANTYVSVDQLINSNSLAELENTLILIKGSRSIRLEKLREQFN